MMVGFRVLTLEIKVLTLNPEPSTQVRVGLCAARQGRVEEAANRMAALLQEDPHNVGDLLLLGADTLLECSFPIEVSWAARLVPGLLALQHADSRALPSFRTVVCISSW